MMMPQRGDALPARVLGRSVARFDCGNPVAARATAARGDVFARRRVPALCSHSLVSAQMPGVGVYVEFFAGVFVRMAGRGRGRECEGKKARRDHQCPFHGIVLELLEFRQVSDDGATIAARVPSTSPNKQLGFQIVPDRARKNAERARAFDRKCLLKTLVIYPRTRAIQ
jgi:hypothetical protein